MKNKLLRTCIIVVCITTLALISLIIFKLITKKDIYYEIGFVSGILMVEIISTVFIARKGNAYTQYDERQMLQRGKCYKWAWASLGVAAGALTFASEVLDVKWENMYTILLVALLVSCSVFITMAIVLGAYEGITRPSKSFYRIYIVLGTLEMAIFVYYGIKGRVIENGIVQNEILFLCLSVLFLLVGVAGTIKRQIDMRKEESEYEES